MTTIWLTSAGSMAVRAWGTRMRRRTWLGDSPTDSPASRWPAGSEVTPLRTTSQITEEL